MKERRPQDGVSHSILPNFSLRKKQKHTAEGILLVVTDPTTNFPIKGLIQAERTRNDVLLHLWPYVLAIP